MEIEEKEEREKSKQKRKTEKQWEATREERVGGWRDFMTKKSGWLCSQGCLAGCSCLQAGGWAVAGETAAKP